MKFNSFLSSIVLCSILSACSSVSSLKISPQTIASASQLAQIGIDTYSSVKGNKSLTDTQVAQLAANDLNGVATVAQAYVGTNTTLAAAVVGAKDVASAAQVLANLPNGTITQPTVNTLFSAASQILSTLPTSTQP